MAWHVSLYFRIRETELNRRLLRGSEVVFELYTANSKSYIRVLWGGQPMKTSTPLGVLEMVPIEDFFKCEYTIFFFRFALSTGWLNYSFLPQISTP